MNGDHGFFTLFASLSLFTFAMLGIVLANNFVMMFIFWELVGLSSYLLIGFWYERASAAEAAKKLFSPIAWAILDFCWESFSFGPISARSILPAPSKRCRRTRVRWACGLRSLLADFFAERWEVRAVSPSTSGC